VPLSHPVDVINPRPGWLPELLNLTGDKEFCAANVCNSFVYGRSPEIAGIQRQSVMYGRLFPVRALQKQIGRFYVLSVKESDPICLS
jgi:hypothetical protein